MIPPRDTITAQCPAAAPAIDAATVLSRLAAGRRSDQELHLLLPLGPGVDQPDGCEIAVADQKVLRAQRSAMGQIEGELLDGHEARTRER